MSNVNKLLTFGKYKGQPVEVLQNDPEYCQWLLSQPWVDKHLDIKTLIINNFGESSETPEHNKLQTKFLDKGLCLRLIQAITVLNPQITSEQWLNRKDKPDFTQEEIIIDGAIKRYDVPSQVCATYDEVKNWVCVKTTFLEYAIYQDFEPVGGGDLKLTIIPKYKSSGYTFENYYPISTCVIELKPTIGDDYPAILRKAKRTNITAVVCEKYTGQGATLAQVKQIFALANIKFLLMEEINDKN